MTRKGLIGIIFLWLAYQIIAYYFIPYFFAAILWLLLSFALLIGAGIQLNKLIAKRKQPNKLSIAIFSTSTILFILTFTRIPTDALLEKMDWLMLYNSHIEIVKKVTNGTLNPDAGWDETLCQLPYEFPVVSNGGNDILIFRNHKMVTVQFWTLRNVLAPSASFVYTNDPQQIKTIEQQIAADPQRNWKLEQNWYRIYEND